MMQWLAIKAHNLEVVSSNLTLATNFFENFIRISIAMFD